MKDVSSPKLHLGDFRDLEDFYIEEKLEQGRTGYFII